MVSRWTRKELREVKRVAATWSIMFKDSKIELLTTGLLLSAVRKRAGWSQPALAKAISISQSSLSRIERGEAEIGYTELTRALQALSIVPNWFYDKQKICVTKSEALINREGATPDEAFGLALFVVARELRSAELTNAADFLASGDSSAP